MKQLARILGFISIFGNLVFPQEIESISAREAYKMLEQPSVYLIDVRSVAEYVFVGHPEKAHNIPLMFWSEKTQKLIPNEEFLEDIESRFKPENTLIFMCRSGGRSARAYRMLQAKGFNNLYNIQHGFEGELSAEGYRTVNGWRNSGLPYTYKVKEELAYR